MGQMRHSKVGTRHDSIARDGFANVQQWYREPSRSCPIRTRNLATISLEETRTVDFLAVVPLPREQALSVGLHERPDEVLCTTTRSPQKSSLIDSLVVVEWGREFLVSRLRTSEVGS